MKNLNKKIIIATALFLTPAFAMADMQMGDSTMSSGDMMMTSNTTLNSSIYLKGKIEGYKTILAWNKSNLEGITGYKIVLTTPDGTQKTISVQSDKTMTENWDAKSGKNVYQLFVMGDNGELSKSNEVILNMGPNGGYDFGGQTQNGQGQFMGKGDMQNKPMMGSGMVMGSGMTSENKSKMEYLKKSLEEQIKTLRESITPENLEEIKAKAEILKQEYIKKVEELGFPEMKKMIEERFNMFYQNNFMKKEEFKKIVNEKKEQFNDLKQEKKEQFNNFKQEGKEKANQIKEEFKNKKEEVKNQFQNKKQDLKTKYKEQFTKTLESKLSLMPAEKIKAVIAKIDIAIEKYNSNEKLTQTQKEKFTAQLNAIKELLQDKLDELEGGINIDELLN